MSPVQPPAKPPRPPLPPATSYDVDVRELQGTVPLPVPLGRMRSKAPSMRDAIEALSQAHRLESVPPAGRYVFLRLGWALWEAGRFMVRSKYATPIGIAIGAGALALLHKLTHILGK